MEHGRLNIPARYLNALGDNLRQFAFIAAFEFGLDPDLGGCTYDLIVHPNGRDALLAFIQDRVGRHYDYRIQSSAVFPQSQRSRKATLASLRHVPAPVNYPTRKSSRHHRKTQQQQQLKKQLDPIQAGTLTQAIDTENVVLLQAKIQELGSLILAMPLDRNGMSLLHYAAYHLVFSMVAFLVQHGARVSIQMEDGQTPLDLVHHRKQELLSQEDHERLEITRHLLEHTRILDAVKIGAYAYAEFVLKGDRFPRFHQSANQRNHFGTSCLHYAVTRYHESRSADARRMCLALTEHRADLYGENKFGIRPIDECLDKKLKDELVQSYNISFPKTTDEKSNAHHRLRTAKSSSPPSRSRFNDTRTSDAVGVFWGHQKSSPESCLDGGKLPRVENATAFQNYLDQHTCKWSRYVSQAMENMQSSTGTA